MTAALLTINEISKIFPGVHALDRVNLQLEQGEVHALVGENGAGKSTLVKILCGVHQPDGGDMLYNQQPYAPRHTLEAMSAGIRVIYQEFNLLSYLSIAENIFFEHLPRRYGLVDYRTLYDKTRQLLDEVGLSISPKTRVEQLGVAQMQLVEIAKALSGESKLLIMDEPTATLTSKEITKLFDIIEQLKRKGVTILYISHRLQEIFDISDRVTVLRNGRAIDTCLVNDVDIPGLVKMMVGKSLEEEYPFNEAVIPGPEILRIENLKNSGSKEEGISFSLRQGELLGIAGLVGSGRTEAMRAIFGADPKEQGTIALHGRAVTITSPKDAVAHGICLLTEDRKSQGLLLDMPCYSNISLTRLRKVSRFGCCLNKPAEKDAARKLVGDLAIKTPSIHQSVKNLSGGNQQKVVLAKWLFRNAEVLIFDEPTRGIDVGAKYEIYSLLWELAAQGKGMIIVSSDLPELLGLCHRILVFSKGAIAGEVERKTFNQEHILALAYQEYLKERV